LKTQKNISRENRKINVGLGKINGEGKSFIGIKKYRHSGGNLSLNGNKLNVSIQLI